MSAHDDPVVLRSALKQLAREARLQAATVPMHSAEHAFYSGVAAAAEDRLHPARQDIHGEAWLSAESPAFREGYIKASTSIAVGGHGPLRLPLPVLPTPQ